MDEKFHRFAAKMTEIAGSSRAFLVALLAVILWAISGPFLGFSESWQITINTGTTIVTFLMIFLIQHAQNEGEKRDREILKELLRAVPEAREEVGEDDSNLQ